MGITITNSGQGSVVRFRNLGRGGVMTSTKNPPFLLLNYYPGAAAAYSLRKLDYTYTGPAIRVRRSSDNAEQNIGFVNNVLDTTSLLTFCGAGNGFVTTWYDQSGNGRNATRTATSQQPPIVTSGAVLTLNGKPCLSFNNVGILDVPSFSLVSDVSYFMVQRRTTASSQGLTIGNTASFGALFGQWNDGRIYFQRVTNSGGFYISAADTAISYQLLEAYNSGSSMSMYKNGDAYSFGAPISFSNTTTTFNTVGFASGYISNAFAQEVIVYTNSQLQSRLGIESNINSHYSIYTPVIVLDPDAQSFVNRVSIAGGAVSQTEASAVNTLTIALKSVGVWNKLRVIYPMVGASAAACSQNLKSSLYTATFLGNETFSSNGVQYGNFGVLVPINLNTMNSVNDISFGYYCRNDVQTLGSFGWGFPSALAPPVEFYIEYNNGTKYGYLFDSANDGGTAGDSRGLNSISRIGSTTKYIQKNNTIDTYTGASSGTLSSRDFYFGRGSQASESGRENAFGFIGDGLTSTNLSDLYTIVQAFQTTLGRQV